MLSNRWAMGRGKELLEASREGRVEKVETIIGQITKRSGPFPSLRRGGATINVQDEYGQTPLHLACLSQHKEIVRLLLSVDASANMIDNSGAAPLHYAAFNGNQEIVAMLLAHNPPVDIDLQTKNNKESALLTAARFGHIEVLKQLTAQGANVKLRDVEGYDALDLAAQFGKYLISQLNRAEIVTHLLRVHPDMVDCYKPPYSKANSFVTTPMHIAVRLGHKQIVLELLAAGVDPNVYATGRPRGENIPDLRDDGTPLHVAVFYARASIVRILLTKGANLYVKNRDALTVKDLLIGQTNDASRKIQRVIQEYEKMHKLPVDSEDERPTLSASPTGYQNPPAKCGGSVRVLPPDIIANFGVTNTFPKHSKTNVSNNYNIDLGFKTKLRSNTVSHTKTERQLSSTSSVLSSRKYSDASASMSLITDPLYANSNEILGTDNTDSKNSFETIVEYNDAEYGNITSLDIKKKISTGTICSSSSLQFSNNSLKKVRPLPPPKPNQATQIIKNEDVSNVTDDSNTIDEENSKEIENEGDEYFNMNANAHTEEHSEVYANFNGNISKINTSTDHSLSDMYESMSRKNINPSEIYVVMNEKVNNTSELYETMNGEKEKGRSRSKIYSIHCRGDGCCLYSSQDDYKYIYFFNQDAVHSENVPLFNKIRDKTDPMPCFCDRKLKKEPSELEIFKSCESVYVDVTNKHVSYDPTKQSTEDDKRVDIATLPTVTQNTDEDEPLDDSLCFKPFDETSDAKLENQAIAKPSGVLRKKMGLIKQLLLDWKAPETQKNTNNLNDSLLLSSSSSSINHPSQSFVKKLAQKCLGLKARFNSAPNISNTAVLDTDIETKLKQIDEKNNTNSTLHIGNSKFFKILLKKEDSGDVVCNDEFDTISLDRLGTLHRDSVVNRSNRSCPGFKTSLPNISENNELGDSDSVFDSVVNTELGSDMDQSLSEAINVNMKLSIFEPREMKDGQTIRKSSLAESNILINECYESYEFSNRTFPKNNNDDHPIPKPSPRPTVSLKQPNSNSKIYENVIITSNNNQPTPAARVNIISNDTNKADHNTVYENIIIKHETKPEPVKRTLVPSKSNESKLTLSSISSSLTSIDSMIDESNLEDILISEKSKSFRHGNKLSLLKVDDLNDEDRPPSNISIISGLSDLTQASALENVDCSNDLVENQVYLPMIGTLPKPERKTKVLFRHKTFTNIEVDRNSLPKWDGDILKATLASYHIRGTGHCIYKAPTVQEFINSFNRETLYKDIEPFSKTFKRDSYIETTVCFCKPQPPKHHKSAEDLDKLDNEPKVSIDLDALKNRREFVASSFQCYCDTNSCTLHVNKRITQNTIIVKFSAIKKSISTPDITLESSPSTVLKRNTLIKNKSVPLDLESPYAIVNVEDIMNRDKIKDQHSPIYTTMSNSFSTISSSSSTRPYSIKDITDVISLNSTSTATNPSCASENEIKSLRKSSSSEYSGHWSLHTCNSNVTIKSDNSFKSCLEESSDENSSATLDSDEDSDAETVKSDISATKRPWVHSDSFRFGNKEAKSENAVIFEEDFGTLKHTDSINLDSSKIESGISMGSGSSSSVCEVDGIPRVDSDVSLGIASLERGSGVGGVRSGLGRRRWDETEVTSEGDALSISSAASSCAPHHLGYHHDYSKVSPTPPKKPPRRNLSVSPTHANSPSSGYSYELRTHARSQDDLDEIQGAKIYLKHGRSVDQYVDGKLSYAEYEENHNPRVIPVPNPRPSLKNRPQPVAITAMYENVVIKEQNPRRKLRRSFGQSENERMNERVRKNQEKSLESLLDCQSMNSPSEYEGHRVPLSPTHYDQPPTPDHPPPSARQAENSIHERIRPLSQEYKRRSALRDSQTETEMMLLRAVSTASVASGATDRSVNTDNCVEEYVCDVPFAGLFKGSTTTLDGIGLRPMPAERPKTLRKLKSVYDASPTEPTSVHNQSSNGQPIERNINGMEEEIRKRSNTTSSNHSGDKSLSILSPFDEQEEWAKISEIMASFGSKLVRESVFVSELEQEFTSRLGLSCSESSLSPSVASNLGLWLSGLGLHDYEPLFLESGFDDIDFVNGILDDNDLREMGIEENDRHKILESSKQLPLKITEISNNYNNNNISKNQNESVEEWLRHINLEQHSDTFRKHLYVDMDRVRRIWEVELTAVLEIQKPGHRKRILASVSGEHNGPANNMQEINADLNSLKTNIKQLKEDIKEKLPHSENLKAVPPPVVPSLAPPGGETLKRSKKNRPAPQPPRPSDLEIRAPSELMVGVPGALKTQWKHQPFVLVTGAVTYVANYLGSTVVKELKGTESTKKSIQKLKKTTKEPRDAPDIILSISYRGVKFLNTITRELVCEHEIRNIHCACQDADDLTHFAYITKDHTTKSHYCHVFRVATMDQATEVILTLGEAFEVAYQMALREQSNRTRVTQSQAKTPTHDPMTTSHKEKPNVNHGRSHSITEIKLNGHQLKIAPIPASLSNEDFQMSSRNSDGSRSPRTPLLKAPIASTEEL